MGVTQSLNMLSNSRRWLPRAERACQAMFRAGLEEEIQDELATHDLPHDFKDPINLALCTLVRLCLEYRHKLARSSVRMDDPSSLSASLSDTEPMQVGRLHLTPQERQQQLAWGLCLYCGKPGHFVAVCPAKVKAHQ